MPSESHAHCESRGRYDTEFGGSPASCGTQPFQAIRRWANSCLIAENGYYPIRILLASILLIAAGLNGYQLIASEQAVPESSPALMPAADVFTRMRLALNRVSSLEYSATTERFAYRDGKESKLTQASFVFALEGNLFYIDADWTDYTQGTNTGEKAAFNGDKYQVLLKGGKVLQVQSQVPERPYKNVQPFMIPYAFLRQRSKRFDMGGLQDEEAWNRLAANAKVVGLPSIDGQRCAEVHFTTDDGNRPRHFRVYAALDLDCFPIKWERTTEDGRAETITTVTTLETSKGRVVMPLSSLTRGWDKTGKLLTRETAAMAPRTLHVNRPIPNERFTIAQNEAKAVRDIDARTTTVGGMPVQRPQSRPYQAFTWAGAGLIGLCLVLWWVRRRQLSMS